MQSVPLGTREKRSTMGLSHYNNTKKSMNMLVHSFFICQGVSRSAFFYAALWQQDYFFMNQTKGCPLSQGVPSPKTVHRTVLGFTPCRRIETMRFHTLRSATRALPSTCKPMKRLERNFYSLERPIDSLFTLGVRAYGIVI